jgi:hypothetical protein
MVRCMAFAMMMTACGVGAEEPFISVTSGGSVILVMAGDVASDYQRRCGIPKESMTPTVEAKALVTESRRDGRFSFEHQNTVKRPGQAMMLVTLSGETDRAKISSRVTSKHAREVAGPSDGKLQRVQYEVRTPVVTLNELQSLKLQTWSLVE